MFELKTITPAGVPAALKKAERYRLLNDSAAAESICRDVLAVDEENQSALVTLLLAITDQFRDHRSDGVSDARAVLERLSDEYTRCYYAGIICERRAMAVLHRLSPGAGEVAYEWLREAMSWYERAEAIRPAANDEAILRWNTCVRVIRHDPTLRPAPDREYEPAIED